MDNIKRFVIGFAAASTLMMAAFNGSFVGAYVATRQAMKESGPTCTCRRSPWRYMSAEEFRATHYSPSKGWTWTLAPKHP